MFCKSESRQFLAGSQACRLPRGSQPALGTYAGNVSALHGKHPRRVPDVAGHVDNVPIAPAPGNRSSLGSRARRLRRDYTAADVERRRLRNVAQGFLKRDLALEGLGMNFVKCGRVRRGSKVIIADSQLARSGPYAPVGVLGVRGKWAAFTGLVTCGSPWACPVCSAKLARERAEELRSVVARCRAEGGELYMLTLTTPHDQGDALKPLFHAVADSWRNCLQGRAWRKLSRELGYLGFVRGSDEPTVGPNGWHPHLHVLLFFFRPLSSNELDGLKGYFYSRWVESITQRHGYRAPSPEHGVVLTSGSDGEYLAKLGLADELASGLYKQAREGHRTPLQLLQDAAEGDLEAEALWIEYYSATFRRRRLTWSQGLRKRYCPNPERSDAEIAAADEALPGEEVFQELIPADLWDTAIADNPYRQSELLRWGKRHGAPGVRLGLLWCEIESKAARLFGLDPCATLQEMRARLLCRVRHAGTPAEGSTLRVCVVAAPLSPEVEMRLALTEGA